jgi:hypothetical protein
MHYPTAESDTLFSSYAEDKSVGGKNAAPYIEIGRTARRATNTARLNC